jgi:hypothetical protein
MDQFHTDIFPHIFEYCDLRSCVYFAATTGNLNAAFWTWVERERRGECKLCCVIAVGNPRRALIRNLRAACTCPCGAIGWGVHKECSCFTYCKQCSRFLSSSLCVDIFNGDHTSTYYVCKYSCRVRCCCCRKVPTAKMIKLFSATRNGLGGYNLYCSQYADFMTVSAGLLSWLVLSGIDWSASPYCHEEGLYEYDPAHDGDYTRRAISILLAGDQHNPNLALLRAM